MQISAVPMNNLKEAGIDLLSLAQNTPDFLLWYKPGSIIIGLALWFLQHLRTYKNYKHQLEHYT